MALWSAALFGHYKPRVDGWERRAEPGDIISVRPYSEHSFWTPTERKEFLIVTIDDFELSQLSGLTESKWDTESYIVVPENEVRRLIAKGEYVELYPSKYINKRRFNITLDDLRDAGVDINKMLDKEVQYSPELDPIFKVKCYDKLKNSYSKKGDKFNLIPPIKIGKMF